MEKQGIGSRQQGVVNRPRFLAPVGVAGSPRKKFGGSPSLPSAGVGAAPYNKVCA
jgi:hypothetical protein